MNQNSACPNCHAELKIGFLNSNKLLEPSQIAVINEYHEEKSEAYCNKCGQGLYDQYKSQLNKERKELVEKIQKLITAIPVISTHSPHNWDYNVLDMVTGQTTTGTGVISEFTSSFTDLFGAQSGRHNRKLKAGEDMCFAQLRKQTLDAGGNAVRHRLLGTGCYQRDDYGLYGRDGSQTQECRSTREGESTKHHRVKYSQHTVFTPEKI